MRANCNARLSVETKRQLDALLILEVNEDGTVAFRSTFGHLKTDAGTISLKGILAEIEKLQRIRQVALPVGLFEDVPSHLVKVYRERVMVEKPREVRRHSDAVRYTLLAAFCWLRCREIIDNLVDLFIGIVKRIMTNAENTIDRKVLQEVKRVRGKGRLLFHIAKASVTHPDGIVSEVVYPVASEQVLNQIVAEFQTMGTYEVQIQQTARNSYARHYRRMVPPLLQALQFRSNNEVHQPLIRALDLIEQYVGSDRQYYLDSDEVPLNGVVLAHWRDQVIHKTKRGQTRINRISYEICLFQALREQVRCRAIWVEGADRYRNPDEDLPPDFNEQRTTYYEALQQPLDGQAFVNQVRQEMVEALTTLNEGLPTNAWLTIEANSKRKIKLSPLQAQSDPINLYQLKRAVQHRWPMTSLLDMLKETDMRVHFTDKFQTTATRETLNPAAL